MPNILQGYLPSPVHLEPRIPGRALRICVVGGSVVQVQPSAGQLTFYKTNPKSLNPGP